MIIPLLSYACCTTTMPSERIVILLFAEWQIKGPKQNTKSRLNSGNSFSLSLPLYLCVSLAVSASLFFFFFCFPPTPIRFPSFLSLLFLFIYCVLVAHRSNIIHCVSRSHANLSGVRGGVSFSDTGISSSRCLVWKLNL